MSGKWWAVAVLILVSVLFGGQIGARWFPAEVPRELTPSEIQALVEVRLVEVNTVREIPMPDDLIEALEAAQAGHLREFLRVVTRIEGRVQDHRVHIDHDDIPEFVLPESPVPGCPPCDDRPSGDVAWSGGCSADITEAGGRRFARLMWDASASGESAQGLPWSIGSGEPFAVEELTFDEAFEQSRLPRSKSWGLGVGLWSPRSSYLDPSAIASLRRSSFGEGRRWGWFGMLEASVSAGDVSSGSISHDQPRVGLGGAGVQIGIERRGG